MLLKSRHNYPAHGATMGTAIALHTVSIFAIMVPSFVDITHIFGNLVIPVELAIICHAILGSVVEVIGIYLVIFWTLHRWNAKVCLRNKRLMTCTFILWLMELALGILVYIQLYPPF
jgi:uncharacterized membrane protein YozB (DUF420 family)